MSLRTRLKALLPPALYYGYTRARYGPGEPELHSLDTIVPRGRLAIDVGANRGLYSYFIGRYAARVEAFESNPALAARARRQLWGRITMHEVALAARDGVGRLHLPLSATGRPEHVLASLKPPEGAGESLVIDVPVRTLDGFGFTDVGFIKIDVEGAEEEVLAGAEATIRRDRPTLLVEIFAGHYPDPAATIAAIAARFGHRATIATARGRLPAEPALAGAGGPIISRNVLFTPLP